MLTGIINVEAGQDPYKRLSKGSDATRDKELNVIFKITMLVLILEAVQIIVFVVSVLF